MKKYDNITYDVLYDNMNLKNIILKRLCEKLLKK